MTEQHFTEFAICGQYVMHTAQNGDNENKKWRYLEKINNFFLIL